MMNTKIKLGRSLHHRLVALLASVLFPLFLSGCDDDEFHVVADFFATGFYRGDKLMYTSDALDSDSDFIIIKVRNDWRETDPTVVFYFKSDFEVIESIAHKHGDSCSEPKVLSGRKNPFPPTFYPSWKPSNVYNFLEHTLSDLEVTTSLDWSEEEPAGSSLKEHFIVLTYSYIRYAQTCTPLPEEEWKISRHVTELPALRAHIEDITKKYGNNKAKLVYHRLNKVPWNEVDYLGFGDPERMPILYLYCDHPMIKETQELTFTATFTNGAVHKSTIKIN